MGLEYHTNFTNPAHGLNFQVPEAVLAGKKSVKIG